MSGPRDATQADRAYNALLERILSNALKADEPIRQDAIAKELGLSKIPLREALARLESGGLVAQHAHRGFVVRPATPSEAEDIFHLRHVVEPEATALGSQGAAPADHDAAEAALAALNKAIAEDSPDVGRLNREFHLLLVRPAGRDVTTKLVEQLLTQAERYVRIHLHKPNQPEIAALEHRSMLDQWRAKNEDALRGLVTRHIDATLDYLLVELAKAGKR